MDRLRKINLRFGRFHVHLDLLGLIAFAALALTGWSVTRITYAVNTERKDRVSLEKAIIEARRHDCMSGNIVRKALTDVVTAQSKLLTASQVRKFSYLLSPEVIKKSEEIRKFELETLRPRNCNSFTNQVNPKKESSNGKNH